MLLRAMSSGADFRSILISLLLTVPIVLISLTFHEVAHGFISYKLGDPTAYNLGRLTLNPVKHLDPLGTMAMLVFGVGWAKPVPVNARYYKKPKWGMALTALAGPLSNILLAFVGAIIYYAVFFSGLIVTVSSEFAFNLLGMLDLFLYYFITMNAFLAVFNLLPVPPFDGSRIAFVLLPDKVYFSVMRYERVIMIAMLFLLYFGYLSGPLNYLASGLTNGMLQLIHWIWTGIASLF